MTVTANDKKLARYLIHTCVEKVMMVHDLSPLTGIDVTDMGDYLYGRKKIPFTDLIRITEALSIPLYDTEGSPLPEASKYDKYLNLSAEDRQRVDFFIDNLKTNHSVNLIDDKALN